LLALTSIGAVRSPIHTAAANGDLYAVQTLLDKQPELISALDDYNNTPLHLAAANGHTKLVELLLARNAKVEARNRADETPLFQALFSVHKDTAEVLIAHGADFHSEASTGGAFVIAALLGHAEIVEYLINKGMDVNARDNSGRTALHAASIIGIWPTTNVIKLLIAKGADVNAKEIRNGFTPLHIAAKDAFTAAVEILINAGADVNAKSMTKDTPLQVAVTDTWKSKKEVVALLIAKGCDINATNMFGCTALHSIAKLKIGISAKEAKVGSGFSYDEARRVFADQLEVVKFLVAKGANVNSLDDSRYSPLFWAVWADNIDAAKLLINLGAKVNLQNKFDESPLHIAARRASGEMAELLILNGASFDLKDSLNKTPLAIAIRNRNDEVVTVLRSHGAQ
jgi:ankyrin repeat protein